LIFPRAATQQEAEQTLQTTARPVTQEERSCKVYRECGA